MGFEAWAIYYGEFVPLIDHKNLVPSENWIDNLRKATHSQNQHNRSLSKNNKSGFKGVCWHAQNRKWRAYIVVNWKQRHLGLFDTPEEAHLAYCKAADELHGLFANHGGIPVTATEAANCEPHDLAA
ncbi:Phage-associated homing endonuclease [Caballeronia glathei]|uniref:AP2 domain-containing protein n=1 Tax=Caballeronia glathei TaxID=60547 RepID=UPI000504BDBD|nr:Phage-associated homing endonuclease [Caballeronia glathei]